MSENDWSYAITAVPMARIPQTELDALRAEVDRLKALCGRALEQLDRDDMTLEAPGYIRLVNELREASK